MLREALLDEGRVGEVATNLVVEPDDPDTRHQALLDVQQIRRAPPLQRDGDSCVEWLRLLEGPDVRAAIARHGHRGFFDVHRDEAID